VNVLLVNPCDTHMDEVRQKCYPPLNLMYLAAALREAGHCPAIVDANAFALEPDEIAEKACAMGAQLVGVPLLSETAPQVYRITRAVRRRIPGVHIVLGGPTATAWAERSLVEFDTADFVIAGEGERPLAQLCNALEEGGSVSNVPGLAFRKNGRIVVVPPAPPEREVDRYPMPARDLVCDAYEQKRYYTLLVRERPTETLTTTRGCPFKCAFCYNTVRRYRMRSPETVMDEIVGIYDRGVRHIEFVDDNFTLNRDHAMAIFNGIIRERLGLRLVIKSRVNVIDAELLARAKAAGVYQISYGMESGVQYMLDRMRKGTKVEDNERANRLTKEAGINSHTSWFFGFPGETPETIEQTIDFIVRIRPTTANFGVFRPYPATQAYEEAKAAGTLVGDWSPHSDSIPWVRLPWTRSRADLERYVRVAQRRLYIRPYYALNFSKEIIRNANLTMASYAWQEAVKVLMPG